MNGDPWGGAESANKEALAHAWAWFSMHAAQRMQLVSFFFVGTAFLTSAYTFSVKEALWPLTVAIGIAGAVLSVLFHRLEVRTKELVKAGERAMSVLETKLAASTGVHQIKLVDGVEDGTHAFTKYSTVIWLLHLITGLAFAAGATYGLFRAVA